MTNHNLLTSRTLVIPVLVVALMMGGCTSMQQSNVEQQASPQEWLAYRVRSDFDTGLNSNTGWAAPENTLSSIHYDQPFRLRVQVKASFAPPEGHVLALQYRKQGGDWRPVGFAEFPYPGFATPLLSTISTTAYVHGAETERLLGPPNISWDEGAGLSAVASTPVWRTTTDAVEWEWPLVIRRFSDGPTFAEDGSIYELRLVDGLGRALTGQSPAQLQVTAIPGHLGGTFIETPGRLGPYQSDVGHLYFFMEPSETDNRFMAVRSTDFGTTWREVDASNRPVADDLEGVASARAGSTVHIIHQVSEEVFYHQFEMGNEESTTGTWRIESQSIARLDEPPTQFADLVVRSDGSLVTLYGGAQRLFLQTRSVEGLWAAPVELDVDIEPQLSGPMMAVASDNTVTLAYTGKDGSGFVRHLRPDNALSPRIQFSSNLGSDDSENGAIVPMVVVPESGTTVLLYREQDGTLYERRFSADAQLTDPVAVSSLSVVTDAVDSEQVGADLILYNETLHVLFIEQQSRSIFHTYSAVPGQWSEPQVIVENINAAWVRGSVHLNASGNTVYGFVYDAGSNGGSGFNRYYALPL